MILTFDKEMHEYRWGERIVPSVTQLLPKQKFDFISEFDLALAIEEGNKNHSEVEQYVKSGVVQSAYVIAFMKFLVLHQGVYSKLGKLLYSEKMFYSEKYRYAGTPDLIFENGIVDLKRSHGDAKIRALQLAGYHNLAIENKIIHPTKKWFTLVIKDQKPSPKNIYHPMAERVFLAQSQARRSMDSFMRTN